MIQPLKAALQSQADTVLADAAKQDIAEREVTILGDRTTPYSVLRKVMATCTEADYGKVSLAVIERETRRAARRLATAARGCRLMQLKATVMSHRRHSLLTIVCTTCRGRRPRRSNGASARSCATRSSCSRFSRS